MDKWHHIVFSRASGTHKYFLDGEIVYNTALSINFDGSDQSLVVGRFYSDNSGYNFNGSIDEIRISKDIARWTGEFTPPSLPYENAESYTYANFFDGTLAEPQMFDYVLSDSEIYDIYTSDLPSVGQSYPQRTEVETAGVQTQDFASLLFNAPMVGSPNDRIGTLAGTARLSSTQSGTIGSATGFTLSDATGDVEDINTKLLLHLDGTDNSTTDADFIDSSASSHTVTQEGDAKLENTEKQFGETSAYFDGTGDYLSVPDSDDWEFGSGDFTIDFWVNFSTLPN